MVYEDFQTDLSVAEASLGLTKKELATSMGVSVQNLYRWEQGVAKPSALSLEAFYAFLYQKGVRLNDIKAQLAQEEHRHEKILFHGSRFGIDGELSLDKSQPSKDFGRGFYCGESLEQSISFVAMAPGSSVYLFALQEAGLQSVNFSVEQDWMLSIAYFRGRLGKYASHPKIAAIRERIAHADVVIAPIADNRMFQIITDFIDGLMTDEQCKHCLSATDLGKQYVLLSEKALGAMTSLEHCYLSRPEKEASLASRETMVSVSADKVRIALAKYKGQGAYIEEILS